MSPTVVRHAGLVLALLLALGACTSPRERPQETVRSEASGSVATPSATPPQPRRPEVGQCYRLRFRDAVSTTSDRPPVPCRRRHTAVTFEVGRLPGPAGRGTPGASTRRRVAHTCGTALGPFLAAGQEELRLSMLTPIWFIPPRREVARGARWFRCDVVVLGPSGTLVPLPGRLEEAYDDPEVVRRLAMCATAAPGTSGFRRVPCGRGHSWRAVGSVDLPGRTYPAPARVSARMEEACGAAAREAAANPLDLTWAQERPTRERWRAGQRYGLCWVPAS